MGIELNMAAMLPELQFTQFIFSLSLFSFFLLLLHKLISRGSKHKLPPSPPRLPIIGNLHQIGLLPHQSLRTLADKYGPLMLLHFGQSPTLVISSPEIAKEVMKTHDIAFSNRPKTKPADILLYQCSNIGFSPYGEYWRITRKLTVLAFLSLKRVQSFQFVREEEVAISVNKIRSLPGASINLSKMLLSISSNIVSRCVFGRKAEVAEGGEGVFGELSRRIMTQLGTFSFIDTIPLFGWMDYVTGMISRLQATKRELDIYLDQVVEEHKASIGADETKVDFVHIILQIQKDGLLEISLTKDNIKAILLDLFVGGTDTSSTTTEWLMAELIKHENVMSKVQEEVRRIVGRKSKVEAEDIARMSYLKCVIKETLRLHPPVPLLVPRETTSSVELLGYTIPPKTTVLVNAFAIQRDPKVWDIRADEFIPERFENSSSSVDFRGQDLQFIPFGAGRRKCPGMTFGIAIVELVAANLLCWFDWKLPDGQDLDMTEVNGLTVHKKTPLYLVPTNLDHFPK